MNKTLVLSVLLLVAVGCSASVDTTKAKPAPAASTPVAAASPAMQNASQANQDFTLVNKTSVEIDKVFIAPHDSDDWEEDILGQDTLPDGQSVDIKFHRKEKAAHWDLRIEDNEGNAIEWENLNLLEISKATLYYENGKARAELE